MKTRACLILLLLISAMWSCGDSKNEESGTVEAELVEIDPEFSKFITAYTAGPIATSGTIKVVLSTPITGLDVGEAPPRNLFTLVPHVDGQVRMSNPYTIEFEPEEPLEPATLYMGDLRLGELIEVEDDLERFRFNFNTQKPKMRVVVDHVLNEREDYESQMVHGHVELQEVKDTSRLSEAVVAELDGKQIPVKWVYGAGMMPAFQIPGIERLKRNRSLNISWNGELIGVKSKGKKRVQIFPKEVFALRDVNVVNGDDQMIELHFNEPIGLQQQLEGLVSLRKVDDKSLADVDVQVSGNMLLLTPNSRLAGSYDIEVEEAMTNAKGDALEEGVATEVSLSDLKPEVEMLGDGVIVPSGSALHVPFKTVNMRAVEVTIRRIYQDNVLQFLQVNELDEYQQLNRVGSIVYKGEQVLDPSGELDLHSWNNYSLDLSKVVKREKGAIYHVTLRLNPEQSVYRCSGSGTELEEDYSPMQYLHASKDQDWSESDWGEYYDSDWYGYHHDYRWDERNDPCKPTYYREQKASQNILISDLGLVMKAGTDKTVHSFVSDLNSAAALDGAKVEFYDYQQRKLATGTTDAEGMCENTIDKKPYAAVVSHHGQRGYLKLANRLSNSLSKFDVGGTTDRKRVKGYLYTERGVRRPGDTLHVNFMLEDRDKTLPGSHPMEMVIYDPKGQQVAKEVRTVRTWGIGSFHFPTHPDAKTGNYLAKATVGNHEFSKVIRVETVKPNRLKIETSFQSDMLQLGKDEVSLKVKWLHGASAKGLKAKVDVSMSETGHDFKDWKDYIFRDPTKSYEGDRQNVFDGNLDEQGNLKFPMNLHIGQNAPGMMKAYLDIKVFEKGGGFSVDRASVKYSPYEGYVGMLLPERARNGGYLDTDEKNKVKLVALDAQGNPIAGRVEIKVLRVGSYSWYDSYGESLGYYLRKSGVRCVKDTRMDIPAGGTYFSFEVPRSDWGTYLIYVKDLKTGHATGSTVFVDWPYGHRVEDEGGASMLDLQVDRSEYKVGEDIQVTFPSPAEGKALITLENGKGLVMKKWVRTTAGRTKLSLKASPEMSPTVYVHASVIQPFSKMDNDMPIRTYGVIPVSVVDPESKLSPRISMKDELRPESTATIRVSESSGKAMTYTLAVVDDGLLDLTHFKTPEPFDHFYAKEALGVRTWDVYDDVRSALNAKVAKLLAVGGGADGLNPEAAKVNRFKPMVRMLGPFHVEAGASATHKVNIPNYVGSCRVMVVAREGRAYGSAEKTVKVRSPLMVLSTLPRVLSPGETVELPVDVFAMEDGIRSVDVRITPNEMLRCEGATQRKVKFSRTGDKVVNFRLKVAEKMGVAKIRVDVSSGSSKAHHEIEIQVRAPNPSQTRVEYATLKPGETWESKMDAFGMDGSQAAVLEVSSFAHIDMGRRLKYLVQYPHGCVEQTTSGAFPQLYLTKLMDLDEDYKASIDRNVKAAISRLKLFQTSNGGLGYWPGDSYVNDWGTNYAGHFLLEAENMGYHVPSSMKRKWVEYQRNAARKWTRPSGPHSAHYRDLDQSYRLYTLALAGKPELGAMNRLRTQKDLSQAARWRLAAAYALIGKLSTAQNLVSGTSTRVAEYQELSYNFGSSERDEAMILEALLAMGMKDKASNLARRLAKNLSKESWMSTQTTAYCLLAVGKFVANQNVDGRMSFEREFDGGKKSTSTLRSMSRFEVQDASPSAKIKNTGRSDIYVRLVYSGIPLAGEESAYMNDLQMRVSYELLDGSPILPDRMEQGTDFIAVVQVRNPGTQGSLRDMALEHLFPSGWEIHNSRMHEGTSGVVSSSHRYQDIRDDRVHTYFDLRAGESKTFKMVLNATYQGRFYLPAVRAYAMYDESISSGSAGQWVEVTTSGEGGS